MEMLKCSNCGADLEVKDNMKIAYCMYCGAKVMLSNSDEKIKVMEMASKIDLLLKSGINQTISYENRSLAYNIAEKIIKLYPSNYLGFLKLAQINLAEKQPLVCDYGSGAEYGYYYNYSNIADNLKQAKLWATDEQMREIDIVALELERRVANEKKQLEEKHLFVKKQMMVKLKEYPEMINGLRIVPVDNLTDIPKGNRIFFMTNKKEYLFHEYCSMNTSNTIRGCLKFYQERLYYCSTSFRKKGFLELMNEGDGFICRAYEVHIDGNGYIVDKNNNNLMVEGKTFRLEFRNYRHVCYNESISLEWKCFWGKEEKVENTLVDFRLFEKIFNK